LYVGVFFRELPLSVLGAQNVPWVPTRRQLIAHVMRLAKPREGKVFYDLGCGDGRVAIEAAKRGAYSVCVELRRDLIEQARDNARREHVFERMAFINDSFFNIRLNDADIVYMYLLTRVNAQLRPKLEQELRAGARVVTLDFEIPGWRPVHVERHIVAGMTRTLYLYVKGVSDVQPRSLESRYAASGGSRTVASP